MICPSRMLSCQPGCNQHLLGIKCSEQLIALNPAGEHKFSHNSTNHQCQYSGEYFNKGVSPLPPIMLQPWPSITP